jgi:hypothetical protein
VQLVRLAEQPVRQVAEEPQEGAELVQPFV